MDTHSLRNHLRGVISSGQTVEVLPTEVSQVLELAPKERIEESLLSLIDEWLKDDLLFKFAERALHYLLAVNKESGLDVAIDWLGIKSPGRKYAACSILAEHGDIRHVEVLRNLAIHDPSPSVRRKAATTLGFVGDESVRMVLLDIMATDFALDGTDTPVSYGAEDGLSVLNERLAARIVN